MILGVCASIIPFPDHNQVIIMDLISLVSKEHLSECYGQVSNGCLYEQSFNQNGHSSSCSLLSIEALSMHQVNGLSTFQRVTSRKQCHSSNSLLHRLQLRRFDHIQLVINRQRYIQKCVLQNLQ
jgi:hypothetical protein